MLGLRWMVLLSLVMGLVGVGGLGWAQAPLQTSPQNSVRLEYDAAKNGPLLIVFEGGIEFPDFAQLGQMEKQEALAARVDEYSKRVVVGGITAVVPKTMQVIETKPGKADPFASLKTDERLKVLLSYFDAAQWALAGSEKGIGLADMSDIEQPLYLSLLPEKIAAQRIKLVAGDQPGELKYDFQGASQEADPLEVRLRLVRKLRLGFSQVNTEDFGYGGNTDPRAGDEITQLTEGRQPRGDNGPNSETIFAFGVPIIRVVPNRLKPGNLDFTDPKLQQSIPLDGDLKTLGDLLKRVAAATGLD